MSDSDLIAFLNARLDEDEAAAKKASSVAGPDWHHDRYWGDGSAMSTTMLFSAAGSPLADTLSRDDEEMAPFIARFDPARALREVEAKRIIVRYYGPSTAAYALAAAYSDHPDYRQEWKP